MLSAHESPDQCQVVSLDMSDHGQSNTVAICRTCPRDRPQSGEPGLALFNDVKERLTNEGMTVMMVHCLGSCKKPCAAALDAPAKPRVRLSGLKDVNATDLIDAALEYQKAISDNVSVTTFPAALRGHITAISPKRNRGTA
jgi:predicted metal-binding protein